MKLAVATWNIWGRAADHEARYPDILSALGSESADVVGLVEVWQDGDELQITSIAEALGYPHWSYARLTSSDYDGEQWGVGVLSRLPIEAERRVEFPNAARIFNAEFPGVVLITTLASEAGPFDLVCLCEWGVSWSGYGVGGTSDRLATYRFLTRALLEQGRPIAPIVVGDFNAVPETRDLRVLTGKDHHGSLAMSFMDSWEFVHGAHGGWTFDGLANAHLRTRPFGRHRIDYVLTGAGPAFPKLWRVNDARVFGQSGGSGMPPSDHYGLRADLELVNLFPRT